MIQRVLTYGFLCVPCGIDHFFDKKVFKESQSHNSSDCLFFIERGPCLATVSLWLLFVYVEASVRLREIKSIPFNLDICRPFAAHW